MAAETPARRGRLNGRTWTLVALLAALTAVVVWQFAGAAGSRIPSSNQTTGRRAADAEAPAVPPPDVRLGALESDRPGPGEPARNPFRFGARAAAPQPAPAAGDGGRPAAPGGTPLDSPRPTLPTQPPIPLKFIGTVQGDPLGVLAALTDGTFVFHGREGDVIDGRYRIVSIGVESIVLEHVDGRGRQTIRLTG